MNVIAINIAQRFSKFPAGRFETDGPFSGEKCRRELIVPALRSGQRVDIDLNGTLGYGSSFLEEAFGGLVRVEGMRLAELKNRLTLASDDATLVDEIWSYIQDADSALSRPPA